MPHSLVRFSGLSICMSLVIGCGNKVEKEIVNVPEVKTVEIPVAIPGSTDVVQVPQYLIIDQSVGIRSIPKSIEQAPEKIKHLGRGVAKVFSATGASGTGFFISKDGLFLTNEHVVPITACAKRRCPGYKIVTGFHKNGTPKSFSDFEVIAQDDGQYDFALIKVHLKNGEQVEHFELSLTEVKFDQGSDGSAHSVIGHPGGASLQYAEAKPLSTEGVSIRFQAVVIPGNSGGPLVDLNSGKVIGLVKNMRTMPVRDESGSVYFENLNQATAIWELDKYLKEKTQVSILSLNETSDTKTLNRSSADLIEPDADDFGSILRRPSGDIRLSQATTLFMRTMGSNLEGKALSLMLEKTLKFNGAINLQTLNTLLKLGVAAGRPLAFAPKDRVELELEINLSTDSQQKNLSLILLNYFDDEKKEALQKICLESVPEIPQLSILAPYSCGSTVFRGHKSIFQTYADWLVKNSGLQTADQLSSVVAFLMMASPFFTNDADDLDAIDRINIFMEERVRDIEILMRNDSYAMGLIKNLLGVGAFKETFQH